MHIAGGADDPLAALRAIRGAEPTATIVLKRGPMGCVVFPGAIPDALEDGDQGAGLPDRGLQRARRRRRLHGRLPARLAARRAARDLLRLRQCLRRLRGVAAPLLARISDLDRAAAAFSSTARPITRCATTRRSTTSIGRRRAGREPETLMALAIDHRAQLEKIADEAGAPRERINALQAARGRGGGAGSRPGGRASACCSTASYGREALFRAAEHGFWIGRPVEQPGSRPLDFEFGGSSAPSSIEWPLTPHDQVPVLLPSRRRAGAEGASRSASCCASTTRRGGSTASC